MTEEVTDAPVEATTEQEISLTLNDIKAMVSVIDICSKRGAFEGSELETVGGLRNRILAFVEQANPSEEEAEADPDPEGREQPESEA